jgi:hypothetical protein
MQKRSGQVMPPEQGTHSCVWVRHHLGLEVRHHSIHTAWCWLLHSLKHIYKHGCCMASCQGVAAVSISHDKLQVARKSDPTITEVPTPGPTSMRDPAVLGRLDMMSASASEDSRSAAYGTRGQPTGTGRGVPAGRTELPEEVDHKERECQHVSRCRGVDHGGAPALGTCVLVGTTDQHNYQHAPATHLPIRGQQRTWSGGRAWTVLAWSWSPP